MLFVVYWFFFAAIMKAHILSRHEKDGFTIRLVPENKEDKKLLGLVYFEAVDKQKERTVYFEESRNGPETERLDVNIIL